MVKVWDPLVRGVHWSLVVCVIGDFALNEPGGATHRWLGYAAAGLVVLRLIWGFFGTPHARFSDFFPTPSRLFPYVRALLRGHEPRMVGHNPLAALMMLTLLVLVLALGVTGFLLGTDAFWGSESMLGIHEAIANTLIALVAVHAGAAIVESFRHRENLVWSMVTGKKRP
ncbi:MAG: cytochrome b/b6 domain-containing protein [Burkholderiaceae bacterium]